MKYTCHVCKNKHDSEELSFAAEAPLQWQLINEKERSLSELGTDQCVICSHEGISYYVMACLEIPVSGRVAPFVWGAWCSLHESSYAEMTDHWEDPKRKDFGPYFGWLCTLIPGYPDTAFLKTQVHQRKVGQRPWIELEKSDHPLSIDQECGVSANRLKKIIAIALHGNG